MFLGEMRQKINKGIIYRKKDGMIGWDGEWYEEGWYDIEEDMGDRVK